MSITISTPRSLFNISNEFAAAMNAIQEAADDGGEITPEVAAAFDAIEMEMSTKLDNCYRVLRTLETEASASDEELDRLKRLAGARRKRADWMKQYVFDSMMAAGVMKHKSPICEMRIQKNSRPVIRLEDGADIPKEFERVKIEFDGTKAYEAWKAGTPLPSSLIVIEGSHLRTCVAK
jgi:hypothetical protein